MAAPTAAAAVARHRRRAAVASTAAAAVAYHRHAAASTAVTTVAIRTGDAGSITAFSGRGRKPRIQGHDLVDLIARDVGTEVGQVRVDSSGERGQDGTHVDCAGVVRNL